MSDKFKKLDEQWMKSMKPVREKQVTDGILKGFSVSVERRILAKKEASLSGRRAVSPVWVPVLAVMVLASLAVLRSPVAPPVEYAELDNKTTDVEEDIAVLKELGAWTDQDDATVDA